MDYESLLDEWRGRPTPGLVVLLREQLQVWEREHGPVTGENRSALELAFREIDDRGDPRDTPRLCAVLTKFRRTTAEALFKDMGSRFPDPMAASVLAEHILNRPGGYEGFAARGFWRLVVNRIANGAHADLVERMDTIHENLKNTRDFRTTFGTYVLRMIDMESLRLRLQTYGKDAPHIAAALPGPREELPVESLFEAVYGDVSDDGARAVLADVLCAQGDPRGTFIQLQLLPKRKREQNAVLKALFEQHHKHWLGPLSHLVQKTGLKYRRGFPAEARLHHGGTPEPFVGLREWRTFERLNLKGWSQAEGLFRADVFDSLHTIEGAPTTLLVQPGVHALKHFAAPRWSTADLATQLANAAATRLETLEFTVGWRTPEIDLLPWDAPIFDGLQTLRLHGAREALLSERNPRGSFTLVIPSDGNHPWEYTVLPGGREVTVRYGWSTEAYGWKQALPAIVSELGSGVDKLTFVLRKKTPRSAKTLANVREILGRLGGDVELILPEPSQ